MHESLLLTAPTLPILDAPLVVAALWGQTDRTGSAVGAARFLRDAWAATEFATIDPDRFYDFTVTRPQQRLTDAGPVVRWPGTRFYWARPRGTTHDVVLLFGREPQLHWRDYATLVADVMQAVGAKRYLALGSRPAYVPHTRPAPAVLVDADDEFTRLFDLPLEPPRSDGRANLQTVVMLHLRALGISSARLTALVPSYIGGGPHPRAALALVEQLDRALGTRTALEPIRGQIDAFEQQVRDSAENTDEIRAKVRELELQYDATSARDDHDTELPTADELVQDIEELLRGHSNDDRSEHRD